MGMQIRLAQAPEDEMEMLAWLKGKGRFLALPSFFPSRKPKPIDLDRSDARDLIFFPESAAQTLLGCVIPCQGQSDLYLIDPSRRAGLVIEWSRTPLPVKKAIVLGGTSVCRLYYDTGPNTDAATRGMARITKQLMSYVRRSCAAKSDDPKPFHVGRHLLAQVESSKVQLFYPNGDRLDLLQAM